MFFARVWFTGVITRRASSRNYTCAPGVWLAVYFFFCPRAIALQLQL